MALYNVESPGGYMNIGLSIPGADILGYKRSYSEQKPWLFEDFDQITFYEVSEDELLAKFHSGRYEYEYEDTVFDMKEHNELLRNTTDEVKRVREEQREAQAGMEKLEKELLEKWNKEKEAAKPSTDTIEELLKGDVWILYRTYKAKCRQIQASFPSKLPSTPMYGRSKLTKATRSRRTRWCPSSRR